MLQLQTHFEIASWFRQGPNWAQAVNIHSQDFHLWNYLSFADKGPLRHSANWSFILGKIHPVIVRGLQINMWALSQFRCSEGSKIFQPKPKYLEIWTTFNYIKEKNLPSKSCQEQGILMLKLCLYWLNLTKQKW